MDRKVLVTGAGGFIGHHLVTKLVNMGHEVRAIDIKYPEFQTSKASEFILSDLRSYENCIAATKGISQVYNLAADMGGIGYITSKFAEIARNNVLINSHMLEASRVNEIDTFFYSSSACIYPTEKQKNTANISLRESDAYPADPEEGYGWEKLFSEKLCEYYSKDYGLRTRVARLHNVYGPLGTYTGGKEKAPAALCRKIAMASNGDKIEIWGDGRQTRSFMFIDDCIEGITRIVNSDVSEPLNLGTDHLISINEMVDLICLISGKTLSKVTDLSKPQGVRGRNSDNSKIKNLLGWAPNYPLEKGLSKTYSWIYSQINI
ncbi:MAG: NAD-dependent dehydratase [Rhodospirillaceae bacterium]|nr:NAD-dependent dehydratase [Rhodospirillaceae bacterium]|tara:strand:+ start:4160 stop:5116 length:957 start_codon:yes stop_codon:yes gene_type:complete